MTLLNVRYTTRPHPPEVVCEEHGNERTCRDLISSADTILEMSHLCDNVVNNIKGLQVRFLPACDGSLCTEDMKT